MKTGFKGFHKFISTLLVISVISALCACGSGDNDPSESASGGLGNAELSTDITDSGSSVDSSDETREAGTSDENDNSVRKDNAGQSGVYDGEAAHLLDVVFYANKEAAEAAAGDRLLGAYDSYAKDDEGYNPMSWCYALIIAVHDETEIEILRGYDGITQGDEISGFIPTDMERYEFMDAGDRIIIQVNVEWYPVFQIVVFDDKYKASVPLGWDIYTSKDENGTPAPLEIMGLKIIHPIALYREMHYLDAEDSLTHYPEYTYGSVVELVYADEENPKLAKRLEMMNAEIEDEYKEGLGMLGLESYEEYASSEHDRSEYYYKNLRTSVCRADDTVLSFVRYHDTDMGSTQHSSAQGFNLDTATGEDVSLDEVLTDVRLLPRAVYERSADLGFEDDVCEAYRDVTMQYIEDGDYISSSYFSWNICYEGLWLHFNDSAPRKIPDHAGGRSSVFLPFTYFPDLFVYQYTNVPDDYCYDIEAHPKFGDYYALELNKDGRYIDFTLREPAHPDSYSGEYIYQFSIETGSDSYVLDEGIFCMDYDAFVVHSSSDIDYLYINQTGGNDNSECTVYQLSRELFYEGTTVGTVNNLYVYGDWNDHTNGINCRIMTDPTHFLMTRRDNRLGYDIVYAYHELARSGEPMKSDGYWTYAFDGNWKLYPLKDMNVEAVNEDCEIIGEATLHADTLIRPYRTDSYGWIDVIDREGHIYRIETAKTELNPDAFLSIDGESAEELFGGISK